MLADSLRDRTLTARFVRAATAFPSPLISQFFPERQYFSVSLMAVTTALFTLKSSVHPFCF
jgi:hypothetical protein